MMQGISWNDKELEVNAFLLDGMDAVCFSLAAGKKYCLGMEWKGSGGIAFKTSLSLLIYLSFFFFSFFCSFFFFFLFPTRMQTFMYSVVKKYRRSSYE